MTYIQKPISDEEPTELFSGSAFGVAATTSDSISVKNFKEIEFFIYAVNKSSATQLDVQIEVADSTSPDSDDWAPLQTESISSGTATQSDYTSQKSLTAFGASDQVVFVLSSPVRGRMMRVVVTADASTGIGTITALRRV